MANAPNVAQVKAMTPDAPEPLPRKKHGEIRIPITAIKNRARAPPEASRKRKMEMDQGFVEVEFQIGEHPLGLVVDWSMALPVVSGVLPGTHASILEDLRPGLVLLAINDIPLIFGVSRHEVERILSLRPLSLLFEAPIKELFDVRMPVAWQRSRRAAFYDIPQGETGPVDQLSVAAKEKKPGTANSWASNKHDVHTPGDKAMSSTMTSVSFARMDFFEEHPERSPLSRFGDLNIFNGNPFSGEARYRMGRTLPSTFGQAGSASMSQLHALPATPASSFSSDRKKDSREGPTWLKKGSMGKISDPNAKSNRATRGWLGSVEPDLYYKQLLDEEKLNTYGPGTSYSWLLGHEMEYECRLVDMILCSKVREAYEVGFRGKKRDKPTDMEKLLGGTGDATRVRRIAKVEQVSCDNCGLHLADADKPGGRFFYYCRQCKRSGRRFELCVACHVLEILQGEGKYSGTGFHPHYLKCKHRSLIRRQSLEHAYPSSPHLHRVLCDLCGCVVVGRGASDHSSKPEEGRSKKKSQEIKGTLNQKTYIVSNEFYQCPTCPEVTGLRFELCVPCQKNISESGHGIQRLESTL